VCLGAGVQMQTGGGAAGAVMNGGGAACCVTSCQAGASTSPQWASTGAAPASPTILTHLDSSTPAAAAYSPPLYYHVRSTPCISPPLTLVPSRRRRVSNSYLLFWVAR